MIFYKNKLHEEGTKKLLKKFQTPSISANKERAAFSYLVGATNRIESVIACFDENNMIDLNLLIETIERKDFSSSEKSMLRSEEHTSELQSRFDLVCRLLLEKKT